MNKDLVKGYAITFLSYVVWGLLPIYWKQLTSLTAINLLTTRIVITSATLFVILILMKNKVFITYIKDEETRRKLLLSAMFIAINWGTFVYAVNSGNLVQASLGYYINPLISVFLGIFILKERLLVSQYVSIAIALAAVLYLAVSYGRFPVIAMVLATTFGVYGLLKKLYQLDSLSSLLTETIFLLPVLMVYNLVTGPTLSWLGNVQGTQWIYVSLLGAVTIVPLTMFSEGAKKIPLTAVGFLQYIAPTFMLLIGVLMYGEPFTKQHAITFGLIWLALTIYSAAMVKMSRRLKRA